MKFSRVLSTTTVTPSLLARKITLAESGSVNQILVRSDIVLFGSIFCILLLSLSLASPLSERHLFVDNRV